MAKHMNYELEHILFLVSQAKPTTVEDVKVVVDDYFRPISWSLLKEEYTVKMTDDQRNAFLTKVLNDVRRGDNGNESRKHNQVDR